MASISRPRWISLGLAVVAILLNLTLVNVSRAEASELNSPSKPDVVIVICDDFNPFYTGFNGDPDAKTPNLDALAKESANFTRCYTTSPVCMPARASLITGMYPHNTGCWGNTANLFIPPPLTSMFTDFKGAGYTTAVIGKTHWMAGSGFKAQFENLAEYYRGIGIDYFRDVATTFGSRSGKGVYQDFLKEIGKFEAQSADLTRRLKENQYKAEPSLLETEETGDWMITNFAVDYIEKAPKSKPFALYVGYSNPHSPIDPTEKYLSMYSAEEVALRNNVQPFKKYGTDYNLEEIRKTRAYYLGKITFLDDLVGRIIAELKARGTWENTILVFTADHGFTVGEQGNISKGVFWEESVRMPLLMRIPGLTDSGLQIHALAQLIDVYPTVLDAMGGTASHMIFAKSQIPVITGEVESVRDAVFSEISHDDALDYMVRDERYKWFLQYGDQYLFDLEADPFETNNLIDSSEHVEVKSKLLDRLREFLMTDQINYSSGYVPLADRVKKGADKDGE